MPPLRARDLLLVSAYNVYVLVNAPALSLSHTAAAKKHLTNARADNNKFFNIRKKKFNYYFGKYTKITQ